MKRTAILIAVLSLVGVITAIGLKPPQNAVTRVIKGKAYYSGEIYLPSHEDTLALKIFGFRDLEFEGRSVSTVRYHALWPQTMLLDSLPAKFQNIEFDVAQPDTEERTAPDDSPDQLQESRPEGFRKSAEPSSEDAVNLFSHAKWRVRNSPRPYDNQPDTVIAGRWFAKGTVFMKSDTDSAALKSLGFFGFKLNVGADDFETIAIAGGPSLTFKGFSAYWPFDVDVKALPTAVHRIKAKRSRPGSGEVVIDRQIFDE